MKLLVAKLVETVENTLNVKIFIGCFLAVLLVFSCFVPLFSVSAEPSGLSDADVVKPVLPEFKAVSVKEFSSYWEIEPCNGLIYRFYKGTLGYNSVFDALSDVELIANEQWQLQGLDNKNWKVKGIAQNVYVSVLSDLHVKVTRSYTDYAKTSFNVTFDFYAGYKPKITVEGILGASGQYRIEWLLSGVNTESVANTPSSYSVLAWSKGSYLKFDYTDVYESWGAITNVTLTSKANDNKINFLFNLGTLATGNFSLDPTYGYISTDSKQTVTSINISFPKEINVKDSAEVEIENLSLSMFSESGFRVLGADSELVSWQGEACYVHTYPILNGFEYLAVYGKNSLKSNEVKFQLDCNGYAVFQDGSLLTELPEKDYIVWTETYAFDGENETRKDISLVGCLRFIPDGSILESVIIKRPYIYDFTGRGVWGSQTYDNGVLTVIIPQEFVDSATYPIYVDPTTIFSDGFESGDFSAWTGTTIGAASSLNTTDTQKHCGTYSLAGYNAGSETAEVYKSISASETVYMRGYFRFTDLPTPGNLIALIGMTGTGDRQLAVSLYNLGGTMNFQVVAFAAYTDYGTIGSLETGVWYCIEAKFYANANGSVQVWLDGTEKFCASGDDFSGRGNINAVRVGNGVDGKDSTIESTIHFDCVVVSDSYIGPETSGPETLSVELSSPTNASTVTAYNQNFTYTPTLIGSDAIQNASLYIDNSLVASNSSAIINATSNGIAYNFTSNGEYTWTVGVWNTTHLVFPTGNYTLTVNVAPSPTPTPSPTSTPVSGSPSGSSDVEGVPNLPSGLIFQVEPIYLKDLQQNITVTVSLFFRYDGSSFTLQNLNLPEPFSSWYVPATNFSSLHYILSSSSPNIGEVKLTFKIPDTFETKEYSGVFTCSAKDCFGSVHTSTSTITTKNMPNITNFNLNDLLTFPYILLPIVCGATLMVAALLMVKKKR